MAIAAIDRGALATSGNYERCIKIAGKRYGHILHPTTGWPVSGLCSVSAIADRCLVAGTVSTVAMLKVVGIDWLAGLGLPHAWMDDQRRRGGSGPCLHWPDQVLPAHRDNPRPFPSYGNMVEAGRCGKNRQQSLS
jgi:hypothetical protein